MPSKTVEPELGMVCWARMESFSWYPARIVERDAYERLIMEQYNEVLAPCYCTNFVVSFFDELALCGVVEREAVCEYCANLELSGEVTGKAKDDILKACRRAENFIKSTGTAEQRERFEVRRSMEDFLKLRGGVRRTPVSLGKKGGVAG